MYVNKGPPEQKPKKHKLKNSSDRLSTIAFFVILFFAIIIELIPEHEDGLYFDEIPDATEEETSELSGRERLNAILSAADDTPANAESKAATEELLRTGIVTYHGHTYTMPWYQEGNGAFGWISDILGVKIVKKAPDEAPSPTPHVFGSNELTEMGRAILNGAVLYTPAPNGNPSRRYKAVFDVAYSIDPERSYGTIGNDLYFDFWVNGERVLRGEKIEIRAGETIEFKVAITEEDNRPDYGSSRVTFTVPNDVKRGKKYSAVKGVFVAEYGGNQYSHGCYETFIVEFSLSVKGKIRR